MSQEKTWMKECIQPAGMLAASSLNLLGAAISLMISDKDRTNPFYYTAMCTSMIYMVSNATKIYQVRQTFREKELEKRRLNLTEIVINK